jgi:hypothetical protein
VTREDDDDDDDDDDDNNTLQNKYHATKILHRERESK